MRRFLFPPPIGNTAIPLVRSVPQRAHAQHRGLLAEVLGAKRIYIGAVYEDSSGYPDCRPEYYAAFNEVIRIARRRRYSYRDPYHPHDQETIIREGLRRTAPLHLTWSCYQSKTWPAVCAIVRAAPARFQRVGIEDPIPYAVRPNYA